MPSGLVLVTGGTGHVGFKVIVDVLAAGYNVRAAIRDPSKENLVLSTASIKSLNPGSRLSFVTVPDLGVDGAYDAAVQDVKYIIHIASPFPRDTITEEEHESEIIIPAVAGTVGMLKSALKTTGVERVVITGSMVSIIPLSSIFGGSEEVFDETSDAPVPPLPINNRFVAYFASKASAFKATREFIEREKPPFDVVTLMPSYIVGKNEMITDPKKITTGSNALAMGQILGYSPPAATAGSTVHIDDVAKAHLFALDSGVPGNTHYLLNSGGLDGIVWGDAIDIVARTYPEAVAAGLLPNSGLMKTVKLSIDTKKAEKAFGIKYLSYEEQIRSVVDHYLELQSANQPKQGGFLV